tara:strand:- start:2971 stop:3300 length:330 start_codon:yes stop_codon:yes gene_type:complete
MKKNTFFLLAMLTFSGGLYQIQAQNQPDSVTTTEVWEEEDGPIIFKFEPDILVSMEARKAEILRTRAILDTMDISAGKRRRLLKDLYKNGATERLSKALIADTKFDDIE